LNINFESYKVFYHVAKTLSFSDASHKLFISQSAVSQSIKQLEEKLDIKLFFRHTKVVKLTVEGEMLFRNIEQAYNLIQAGEKRIRELHSLSVGEVRIGASDTICKYYLLPYFRLFHKAYPKIKITVINRPSPICMELLRKGSVDVSIVNLPLIWDHIGFEMQVLKEIQDVFIAGKAYCELENKQVSFRELEAYPVLLLEKNSTTRDYFDELMARYQVSILPEFELGSMDLLVELSKIGLGISFVTEDAITSAIASKEIFKLNTLEAIPKRRIGVLTKKGIVAPVAAQKFIEICISATHLS